jgi:hypothetical protein
VVSVVFKDGTGGRASPIPEGQVPAGGADQRRQRERFGDRGRRGAGYRGGDDCGHASFGKGSVQTLIPMGDDTAIKLTTARYHTPKDRMINGVGIEPDVLVVQRRTRAKRARTPNWRRRSKC